MAHIKAFEKKQIPIAIASVVVVVAVIVCVLVFGKGADTKKPEDTKESKSQAAASESKKETKPETSGTTEVTLPPTSAPDYEITRSVAIQGNRCMELYGIAPKSLQHYGEIISAFGAKVPNVSVYVMLAPTSIELYGPDSYRTGNRSQKEGIKLAYSALSGKNVKSVDAYSAIVPHANEYVYFRTDHHWTARGAYYAYTALGKAAGFTPTKLEDHKTGRIDGFVGSFKQFSASLANDPDYVEYFFPLTEATGTIYQDASLTNGRAMKIVSESVSGSNKYLCFIEGDNPVEKIVTANKNGRKIAIIKESYGNALAPFLVDNFEEVFVLDPRRGDVNLTQFVNNNGITDVLFVNYTFAPSNPTYKAALEKMLG